MWVRDVMTSRPVTVRMSTHLKSAWELLDQHGITAMPVVDSAGRLRGVVSEADLVRDVVHEDVRSHLLTPADASRHTLPSTVAEVMTRSVVAVRPDTDLADAVELMTSTAVKSLPVVGRDGRVLGIVSRRDVVHALARPDRDLAREVGALLAALGVDWLAEVDEGVVRIEGPVDEKESAMARSVAGTVAGVVDVVIGQ